MPTIRFVKPTKKWQAMIRRKGVKSYAKTFSKQDDAIRWARQIESEIDKGLINNYSITDKSLFLEIVARYQSEITPYKKSFTREVSRLKLLNKHFGKLTLPYITCSSLTKV